MSDIRAKDVIVMDPPESQEEVQQEIHNRLVTDSGYAGVMSRALE
jgi:hypothetical protein